MTTLSVDENVCGATGAFILLVGMQTGTTNLGYSLVVSYKV